MQALSDALPSLEDQAYQRLRQALVEGVFVPGQKLSIRRIAAALGTSPMPARTALRRLAAERAVDVLPSGTATVPRLTRAAFAELGAIRASLEPLAVRLATPLIDAAARATLAEHLHAEHAARESGAPEDLLRADRGFLFALYRAADAPMLLGMIEAAWLRRGPHFWDARWLLIGRVPGAARHAEVLAAIEAGQGETAATLLREEIESTTAYLLERMRFADDPPAPEGAAALGPVDRPPARRRAGNLA
ncbi:GntR family transcriptional regulator [Muricoccus radiodurans]|uniref:GntR family transcriptional regulator n=1 Tax=Muricoccus radiodurans TaxID=2231721 RepID=UPI003CF64EF3